MTKSLLVLGGARSGKSAYAESRAAAHAGDKIYIATAEVTDAEMGERIRHHQDRRGKGWLTVEAPLDLSAALRELDAPNRVILIDCVTVWINNLIFHDRAVEPAVADFCAALSQAEGKIIMVSNEVGFGIVPENVLARRFRDLAGRANQSIAATADEVVLVVAGLPLTMKRSAPE
ncbi:MAG: bifunctional adenosylcobinamide kinase/adenosylcobinamide-phosphate guanylyltransferase [Rhizobiales bacterium]|nr:bifunctional adenosylcobinamide kinase/adenosylcobinamide-phosphate guanylyltransferase [Hyphomicrobiales bacterium]